MNEQKELDRIRFEKTVNKAEEYISYELHLYNYSDTVMHNIKINDCISDGTSLIQSSLYVSMPYTGNLETGLCFMKLATKDKILIRYQVCITNCFTNPICSDAKLYYEVADKPFFCQSNTVCTMIPSYHFEQQIQELYTSIANVEAALAAITNAEGAKVQKLVSMQNISTEEYLCMNTSVSNVIEIITIFEIILKRKAFICNTYLDNHCEKMCIHNKYLNKDINYL